MIVDVTGTVLIPGKSGMDCPGNGLVPGVECCCEECDYLMCCCEEYKQQSCVDCTDPDCPRAGQKQ